MWQKQFRQDLFYRLAVVRLRIPPLRERSEDIIPLAQQFAKETGASLTPEVIALLGTYPWPGNVRELRNTMTRLPIHPDASEILQPEGESEILPLHEARRQAVDEFERTYLKQLLAKTAGNVSRAAELAGVVRQLMTRLVAKHGLRTRDRAGAHGS